MPVDLRKEAAVEARDIKSVFSFVYEFARAAIGLGLLGLVAWTLSSAWNGESLIVEALSVPKRLSDEGFSGQVIASEIVDRMNYMTMVGHREPGRHRISAEPPDVPVKMDISGDGISIEEVYSYVRSLIGSDVNVSGEIVGTDENLHLVTRVNNVNLGCAGDANPAKLNSLIEGAADCIFRLTQPDRYARYLVGSAVMKTCPRGDKRCSTLSVEQEQTDLARAWYWYEFGTSKAFGRDDQAWAHEGLGVLWRLQGENLAAQPTGGFALHRVAQDYVRASGEFTKALELDPKLALAREHLVDVTMDVQDAALKAGDDELQLAALKALTEKLDLRDSLDYPSASELAANLVEYRGDEAELMGAYLDAVGWKRKILTMQTDQSDRKSMADDIIIDLAFAHDSGAARSPEVRDPGVALAVWVALEDWGRILALCRERADICSGGDDVISGMALADGHAGGQTGIERGLALLDGTSPDCDYCLRAKGFLYALAGDWKAAEDAFGAAIKHGPDMPVAYENLARCLLSEATEARARGKPYAQVIRQSWRNARRARSLAPHFADAYEIQGELLVFENESVLSLMEFARANRYAPRWKRLHQVWADALRYADDGIGPNAQDRIAWSLR